MCIGGNVISKFWDPTARALKIDVLPEATELGSKDPCLEKNCDI